MDRSGSTTRDYSSRGSSSRQSMSSSRGGYSGGGRSMIEAYQAKGPSALAFFPSHRGWAPGLPEWFLSLHRDSPACSPSM